MPMPPGPVDRPLSDKMDEVRGALELLEWLSLEGCCVSGDSNFCAIIDKIIPQWPDYLLALKGSLLCCWKP